MRNTGGMQAGDQVLTSGTRPHITYGGPWPVYTAREALAIGHQAVEELGWIQGEQQTEAGVCIAGAMVAAGSVPRRAFILLAEAIGLDDWRKLDEWNDTPGRTITEILDAYTMAEKLAIQDEEHNARLMGVLLP